MGKTAFALAAAEAVLRQKPTYQGAELISADSRQVYQDLEVISGADLPPDFKRIEPKSNTQFSHPYYQHGRVRLHGLSLIEPSQEWSVAHFHRLVWEILSAAIEDQRLVFVVGGTGLYHEQIMNFDPALKVGPNLRVRTKADQMTVRALQDWAHQVNLERFEQMNRSDRYNPRRLVRVIEIGLADNVPVKVPVEAEQLNQLYLGLSDDLSKIERKIEARVNDRFNAGALTEVKKLFVKSRDKPGQEWPALTTLGVEELTAYLNGELDQESALEQWVFHELQYARKQLLWWGGKPVKWFELSDPGWKRAAFAYILRSC